MRTALVLFLFFTCLALGQWITARSWDGAVYVYMGEQRAPASVRTVRDYSKLDRAALYRSVHAQLMAYAQLSKENGHVGIRLGHPLVPRMEGGGREFACDAKGRVGSYDHIELEFRGVGITDSGEPPRMFIDTACFSASALETLETIWVPMNDIVSAQAKDQEITVGGENPLSIRMRQIPDPWPENWVLWTVRFYRQDMPEDALTIDAHRLREASPLLSFDWKAEETTSAQ